MHVKEGIRIASFNIEKFGDKSVELKAGQYSRKDLDMIAKIISENLIDIVAIQEITHQYALKELIQKLSVSTVDVIRLPNEGQTAEIYACKSSTWEGRWAKPRSIYSDRAAEGYAFLWNKKTTQLVTNYNKKVFEPRIGYRVKKGALVRPPFIGRFRPIHGYYEIRIINSHIAWDAPKDVKNENDIDLMTQYRLRDLRINELTALIDTVYIGFEKKHYDVDGYDTCALPMPAYTFLLGDYNLNLPGIGQGAKMPPELAVRKIDRDEIVTVNAELTTLKDTPDEPESKRIYENPLANNYDHFSYNKNALIHHNIADPQVGVVYAFDYYAKDETEDRSKYDLYKDKVSDHLPIILDIDIRKKR